MNNFTKIIKPGMTPEQVEEVYLEARLDPRVDSSITALIAADREARQLSAERKDFASLPIDDQSAMLLEGLAIHFQNHDPDTALRIRCMAEKIVDIDVVLKLRRLLQSIVQHPASAVLIAKKALDWSARTVRIKEVTK